jgi:peptidyl-prolyl cis-trans isomerase D
MLKILRKHSRSWFIALAIGAIVVVFIFWGIGGFRSQRFEEAATVNGVPILTTTYYRQYNQMLREYQERSKGELSEEDLKALRLKERALELLIEEELLQQGARRLGLAVSDAELREYVQSMPVFQENGQFSQRRYLGALSRARVAPADFEAQQRRHLLSQRLIQCITGFAKMSPGELQEILRLAKEEAEVSYLALPVERFVAQQKPTEEELSAYYRDHPQEFRSPDRVKVRYVVFEPQSYLPQATVSPKELRDYLEEHAVEFSRPKLIRVREIFLPAPPTLKPPQRQEVQKKAQGLLRQAKAGADFAKLAQTHAADPAVKAKGGELPPVKRGDKPAAWEQVAFSLKPGEAGLAQTPQGWHLIRLEEVKETEKLPEAQAQEQATARLKQEKSRTLAQEAAQQARIDLSAGSFTEAAGRLALAVKETPLFSLGDAFPGLELSRDFKETALALKPQEVSRVLETPQGFVVMQAMERRAAATPPLAEIKEPVRLAVARQLAKKQAEKEAELLLARLRQGEPLAKVAAQAGLPVNDSGPFTRSQGFLKQPLAEGLTSAAFQLSAQSPYAPKPLFFKDAYYLLAFKARRLPPAEELKQDEGKLKEQLLENKRQILFEAWLTRERQQANIKMFELPS